MTSKHDYKVTDHVINLPPPPPQLWHGENKTQGSNTIMSTSFALKLLELVNILLRDQGYAINN